LSLFVNKRVRISSNVVTLVRRQLPNQGNITVQVGQEVVPADIIGKSIISAGFRSVNIAKVLGESPKTALNYLKRPIGQMIYKGELLAFKPGGLLTSEKVITSPIDGVVESYNETSGALKLNFSPHQKDLPAALFGIVQSINEATGDVIIKTEATEVFGLFGTGKAREGTLKVFGRRGDLIKKGRILSNFSDHILVMGALVYSGAVYEVIAAGISGLITGGINAKDYRSMAGGRLNFPNKIGTDIGISLMVCEGFGSLPIGADIYNLLSSFNNKFVILEGNKGRLILPSFDKDSMIRIRKVALPLSAIASDAINEIQAMEFKVNSVVRIISAPFMAEQGMVTEIDETPTVLQSGVSTFLVTVQTKMRKIRVPYSNLEIIG